MLLKRSAEGLDQSATDEIRLIDGMSITDQQDKE